MSQVMKKLHGCKKSKAKPLSRLQMWFSAISACSRLQKKLHKNEKINKNTKKHIQSILINKKSQKP